MKQNYQPPKVPQNIYVQMPEDDIENVCTPDDYTYRHWEAVNLGLNARHENLPFDPIDEYATTVRRLVGAGFNPDYLHTLKQIRNIANMMLGLSIFLDNDSEMRTLIENGYPKTWGSFDEMALQARAWSDAMLDSFTANSAFYSLNSNNLKTLAK